MSPISDHDGAPAAAHVERLIADLENATAHVALDPDALARQLAGAVHEARVWATARGVPPACIPAPPSTELTLERGLSFLNELASVLRWLDRRATPPGTMAHVVRWLRASGSEALFELDLAVGAVEETLNNLVAVRDRMAELCIMLRRDAGDEADECANRLLGTLDQIVVAVGEIRSGLLDWANLPPDADS